MVAGKVNLNTQQPPVLQALLAGAYQDEFAPTANPIATTGSASASSIATALVRRTSSTTAPLGPLQNISELVGKWNSSTSIPNGTSPFNIDGGNSYVGFSGTASVQGFTPSTLPADLSSVLAADVSANGYSTTVVQRFRESTIRALTAAGQTRVWNLMIDLVAQTGRYPQSANALDKFVVEGEQHYWVHVAIDRFTGAVIDKQIELVRE